MDFQPQFRLIGPVECWGPGGRIDLGPLKQRTVMAALLADTGRVVTQETLIERVWDDAPPAEVRNVLYTYVTRLRRILASANATTAVNGNGNGNAQGYVNANGSGGGSANANAAGGKANGDQTAPVHLVRRSGGYLLEADPEAVDVHRLRTLTARAKGPGLDDTERSTLFRAALAGADGIPLADLTCAWAARAREHLVRQRGDALIGLAAVETRLGRSATVVDALHQALTDQPLAEDLAAALMAALHHAGRTAEALEVFARTRAVLATELGVEPGADLRRLHEEILRGTLDPVTACVTLRAGGAGSIGSTGATGGEGGVGSTGAPVSAGGWAGQVAPTLLRGLPDSMPARPPVAHRHRTWADHRVVRPHMLPAQIDHFAGRPLEEAAIASALTAADQPSAAIVAVIGGSGLGKSALALHVAHLLREEFPDGQLYAELHGTAGPAATAQILVRFLRALGVATETLPDTIEELADLYRGALSGRRVLVVLDGIADEEQVAPLLPGSPDCGVLITSRDHLAGIGCTRVIVDVLREAEAIRLLAAVTGEDRVRAEPQAARALTELCGRLPIAVRIAGARLLTRPHWPIARLVARLSDERGRLDELVHGRMAVRDALDHGYRALDKSARTLFRQLGRLDDDNFDPRLVSQLLGVDQDTADDVLDQLVASHIVRPAGRDDHGKVSYRLGGLARLYARDRAEAEGTDREARRAATLSLEVHRDSRRIGGPGCHPRSGATLLPRTG
jgi:DNA-binding SARP family transcriptional activator